MDIAAGMMANGVPFAGGTRAARRDHVEHPAALVNSSGLWVSSRTRGGAGGMLRLQAADFRSARCRSLPSGTGRVGHPARRPPLQRRYAMTSSFVTKLAVTLALALTTAATVSFAQSRPQSCIPHYDASGTQEAPYC
jgi:hypothetical protein